MSSALNENQWTYNFVSAVRDDGSDRGVARIHADKRPGLRGKLDPIFPGSGAALLTHCFVYVRLECRFLDTSGTMSLKLYIIFLRGANSAVCILATSQLHSDPSWKFNWSERLMDKVRGCPCSTSSYY